MSKVSSSRTSVLPSGGIDSASSDLTEHLAFEPSQRGVADGQQSGPEHGGSGSICMQQYASAPMDASTAAAWRDLYIGMVGAGASLTGLTFVAIALDPHQIERTPLLRLRAANAVWCFVSVMFIGLAVLTPRPFTTVASVAVGVGGFSGAVLLSVRTIRQRIFRQPHPGATVFRATGNIFGFLLAGVGGFSLIDGEQGWVFATLALACVIMLSSGIFASWLLVLQIGVPSSEKP